MFGSYRVAVETVAIVAVLVAIRAVIWNLGITGMSTTPLASSIIGGGVFVIGTSTDLDPTSATSGDSHSVPGLHLPLPRRDADVMSLRKGILFIQNLFEIEI